MSDMPEMTSRAKKLRSLIVNLVEAEQSLSAAKQAVPSYTGQYSASDYYYNEEKCCREIANALDELIMERK